MSYYHCHCTCHRLTCVILIAIVRVIDSLVSLSLPLYVSSAHLSHHFHIVRVIDSLVSFSLPYCTCHRLNCLIIIAIVRVTDSLLSFSLPLYVSQTLLSFSLPLYVSSTHLSHYHCHCTCHGLTCLMIIVIVCIIDSLVSFSLSLYVSSTHLSQSLSLYVSSTHLCHCHCSVVDSLVSLLLSLYVSSAHLSCCHYHCTCHQLAATDRSPNESWRLYSAAGKRLEPVAKVISGVLGQPEACEGIARGCREGWAGRGYGLYGILPSRIGFPEIFRRKNPLVKSIKRKRYRSGAHITNPR